MTDQQSSTTVVHDTERLRYELRSGGETIGEATYHWDQGRVVMDHTVVDTARREKGLGSALAHGALDDLRERGLRVVPQCPFIAAFIDEHPEYQDLVDEAPRDV